MFFKMMMSGVVNLGLERRPECVLKRHRKKYEVWFLVNYLLCYLKHCGILAGLDQDI